MDLLSLDSIIITEDKDESGGFDLNLVDPPEEFMSQEDSIEIQSADPVKLKDIETEGGFDSTPPPNDVNILSSSMQEKSGPNLARSMEIGNEDIQITLDDNDGKNGVAVDLFGFHENSSPKIEENINATPIELEFNHNNTGEQIFITNLEKENLNTDSDEHVKKTIHPDESLQRSLKEETETPDINVSLQAASLNVRLYVHRQFYHMLIYMDHCSHDCIVQYCRWIHTYTTFVISKHSVKFSKHLIKGNKS